MHTQSFPESVYVLKLSVKSIHICPIYFCINERLVAIYYLLELRSNPRKWRLFPIHTNGEDAFLRLVSVSQHTARFSLPIKRAHSKIVLSIKHIQGGRTVIALTASSRSRLMVNFKATLKLQSYFKTSK